MNRVVLDTNVIVSAALPGSRLHSLVEAWQQGRVQPLVSREIFDEYLRVLAYPKFRLSPEDIRLLLEHDLLPYVEFVKVTSRVDVIRDDPTDNAFLACALDGRADAIVSGDHHLLELRSFRGIPVMTGRQLVEQIGKG